MSIFSDPTKLLMWVGPVDVREVPVIAELQKAASISCNGDSWFTVPYEEGKSTLPAVRLRFGLGAAGVDVSRTPDVSALAGLGEFRCVPGKDVRLQVGTTRQVPIYTVVGQAGVSAGQVTSGFDEQDDGLIITANVVRRVGGVVLTGHVENSKFNTLGKDTDSFDGVIDVPMGRWSPLVMFGSAGVSFPNVTFSLRGFAVWVRCDYVED